MLKYVALQVDWGSARKLAPHRHSCTEYKQKKMYDRHTSPFHFISDLFFSFSYPDIPLNKFSQIPQITTNSDYFRH